MEVSEALAILGAKRVIWIDDCFNDTPAQLARLLTNSLETTKLCEFPELADAVAAYEFDADSAIASIIQILTDLSGDRVSKIKSDFFAREGKDKGFATGELSSASIEQTCALLSILQEDRWTFEKADQELAGLCKAGDNDLSYVVDLNESGGSQTRGLDVLRTLWNENSAGTAFILTHETNTIGEVQKEAELRQQLADLGGIGLPLCVIAKERLYENAEDTEAMAEALRIAIKRAGLRRSVHEVLRRARDTLQNAVEVAANNLLSVPPEKLESHVFERGYKEGVSELHVVERALTAHFGQQAREFFGVDEQVLESARRLRALRGIELLQTEHDPDPHLAAFREAEVWESDELLNRALTPIACGDVFEVDSDEKATRASKQKFVLLGQPCDISLRPDEKKRAQDTAYLVPLKNKTSVGKPDPKAPLLPFTLRNEQWACDFRNASIVKLSILDLASFRTDGRVRVDQDHSPPSDLLVGQQNVYDERTASASAALAAAETFPTDGTIQLGLQLSFASADAFKHIYIPTFEAASSEKVDGQQIDRSKRVTWRLRRCGRIRMPYASALLDQYTTVVSRHAFDLDYMSLGRAETPASSQQPVDISDPANSRPPAAKPAT